MNNEAKKIFKTHTVYKFMLNKMLGKKNWDNLMNGILIIFSLINCQLASIE